MQQCKQPHKIVQVMILFEACKSTLKYSEYYKHSVHDAFRGQITALPEFFQWTAHSVRKVTVKTLSNCPPIRSPLYMGVVLTLI